MAGLKIMLHVRTVMMTSNFSRDGSNAIHDWGNSTTPCRQAGMQNLTVKKTLIGLH